jgi:hypothetical protein
MLNELFSNEIYAYFEQVIAYLPLLISIILLILTIMIQVYFCSRRHQRKMKSIYGVSHILLCSISRFIAL